MKHIQYHSFYSLAIAMFIIHLTVNSVING